MSNGKRRFDFLGIPTLGGASNKRARSPLNQTPIGNAPTWNPLTQPSQVANDSQLRSSHGSNTKENGKEVILKLKQSLNVLKDGCGIFGPLVAAVQTLQDVLGVIGKKYPGTDSFQDMASDLAQWATLLTGFLEENQPTRMSKQVENLIIVLRDEADYLKERAETRSIRLDECEQEMSDLERCYRHVEGALKHLLTEASLSMWKTMDIQLKESLLNGMLPTHEALYDSSYADKIERRPCLENTRVTVLDGVRSWIYNLSETRVYWINGMAGTGKTTIAYSVCEELARNERLGASFFVSRTSSQCQDVSRILPTVAYQLARVSCPYRVALCQRLNEQPNLGQRTLSVQFENLIWLPLRKAANRMPLGIVVVIDALDECSDPRSTEVIVNMLYQHASELPVRFFLTSRPDPSIMSALLSKESGSRSVLHLHNVEEQLVKADIKTYLTVSLARLQPTGGQLEWLAEKAGVLFIYAATLVRYVLATGFGAGSKSRLAAVLAPSTMRASKKDRAIDKLYATILEGILQIDEREEHELEAIKQVLLTVVCVREPVTKQALAVLAQVDDDQVTAALELLQSVIHVSEASEIVSTLHASFPEFMLDPLRSTLLNCNKTTFNQYLATRCFTIMKQQLRFNICGLRNSYEFDQNIPDIDIRIQEAISSELLYACRFWAEHLTHAAVIDAHFQHLEIFLSSHLLFWMEVLNLKHWIRSGPKVLMEAQSWLALNKRSHELLDDALELVTTYATNPIRWSTPHIYLSLLPLGSKSNKVRRCYLGRTKGLVHVEDTVDLARPVEAIHTQRINSIACSPDGTTIAVGTSDSKIHVWDSYCGSIIAGPFKAGVGPVEVVVFSPDSLSIASASSSESNGPAMIQIWSIYSGAPVLGPIMTPGASRLISSVSFSPDGARIAFTEIHKYYHTTMHTPALTVLDAQNGNTLWRLEFADPAKSVSFSSCGAFVLSQLFNGKIRIWDSYTGTTCDIQGNQANVWHHDIQRLLASPMQGITVQRWNQNQHISGHINTTMVMVSSPRDEHVTCGYHPSPQGDSSLSRFKISLRDSRTGSLLIGPLGHESEEITTFTFSPDGTRLFSGSQFLVPTSRGGRRLFHKHTTVRFWDIPLGCNDDRKKISWDIDDAGWVRDQESRPTIWIPKEWREIFPLPSSSLVMVIDQSSSMIMRVSTTSLLLGESWAECYNPNAPSLSF